MAVIPGRGRVHVAHILDIGRRGGVQERQGFAEAAGGQQGQAVGVLVDRNGAIAGAHQQGLAGLPRRLVEIAATQQRPAEQHAAEGEAGLQVDDPAQLVDRDLVLAGDAAIVVRVGMSPKPPYDPQRDLAPVMPVGRTVNVLVVSSQTPYRSLAEVIAAAKARPETLTYAHTGLGTSQHIGGAMSATSMGWWASRTPASPLPSRASQVRRRP